MESRKDKVETEKNDYIGSDGLLHCGVCHEAKEAPYPPNFSFSQRKTHPVMCACQKEAYAQIDAEMQEKAHQYRVDRLRSICFPNKHMHGWNFENADSNSEQYLQCQRYVEKWDDMSRDNKGLLLWGDVGTGKSYLAACIANALLEKEKSVYMTNVATILNMDSKERSELIPSLGKYSLLIIDDLGIQRNTEYGIENLYNIINTRYQSQKPLIVTTNMTLSEIKEPDDPDFRRVYDRILSMCIPICFTGESRRDEERQRKLEEFKSMLKEPDVL